MNAEKRLDLLLNIYKSAKKLIAGENEFPVFLVTVCGAKKLIAGENVDYARKQLDIDIRAYETFLILEDASEST